MDAIEVICTGLKVAFFIVMVAATGVFAVGILASGHTIAGGISVFCWLWLVASCITWLLTR